MPDIAHGVAGGQVRDILRQMKRIEREYRGYYNV
jgi:hypothetical protein